MYHLKKIIIEGFKSKDCTIEYTFKDSNFTIVFGENGCGKTTLLQIIHAVFACDESVLVDNQVKKIILIVNCDGVECAVTVCENTFTEEFNTRKKHYNWEEFNKYNLSKIRTGFLSVERCGNGFLENVSSSRIMRYFQTTSIGSGFLKENGIQDVRRLCEHMSEYLSRYSNINTRYRYMDYNIFNNDHLYFSGKLISIGSIEDIILNRYNMVNNLAGQKIQSALFDTFEQIIGSFEVEKNEPNSKEANFHFVSTNIGSNFFIIQKALSSIEDDNEILKIFKENKESEILKKCKANPSICLLLKNIIVAISEEREYLNSVLMLQDEFNSIILKSKQLKIDDDGVKIIITKDMSEHSIDKLSSGEKQLLTQLTCLLIDSHQRDIFLIDEPEVSFNVLWQEKYIDLLKKCSPKTQFILATHSPSIVSEHTEYLEELKWEN